VPKEMKRMFLIYLADHLSKSVLRLSSMDFYKTVPVIGKALIGLLNYYGDILTIRKELDFEVLN